MNAAHLSPRLLPLGDSAWTVEFGAVIDPAIHGRVMALEALVDDARRHDPAFAAVRDLVPTFRSLCIHYDPALGDSTVLGERLLELAGSAQGSAVAGRRWRLPACFAPDFAPDLEMLAERHGLSSQAVIDTVCAAEFRVYMIGFMPGFPYMGGLPACLHTPRLSMPRTVVPARSLAVAGEMCAVYPWSSPGGWNLLGRVPVDLFAAHSEPPALLASGDLVSWYAVDRAEYAEIDAALASGRLRRQDFLLRGEA